MKNKAEKSAEKKQVILQWKKAYVEALIDELQPSGNVLEVGFNHAYAADRIQNFKPGSHTIIEQNPQFAKEAKEWAKKHKNVTIIEGTWQTKLSSLGIFDSIFYNDYPIDSEIGMMNRINPDEITTTSSQARELLSKLENQLSQVKTHYSDEQIDEFYQKIGQHNQKELPSFFKNLKEYGCINEEQYQKTLQKYHLDKMTAQSESAFTSQPDDVFAFLDECLKKHMRKGSRFSCFSNDITSKYEDTQFFENVITNPYLDFNEKVISISVPKFAQHFKVDQALIIVVEKFS